MKLKAVNPPGHSRPVDGSIRNTGLRGALVGYQPLITPLGSGIDRGRTPAPQAAAPPAALRSTAVALSRASSSVVGSAGSVRLGTRGNRWASWTR